MYRISRELFFIIVAGSIFALYVLSKLNHKCDCSKEKKDCEIKNSEIATIIQSAHTALKSTKPQAEPQPPSHPQKNGIVVEETKSDLPPCPARSPHLKGVQSQSIQAAATPEDLERLFVKEPQGPFPPIKDGGVYKPADCKAKQRVAIIIPYRNRFEHLHIQLQNLYPVLQRQQTEFRYFLIEQDMPTTFNQGMLFNIGFLEAMSYGQFDCFIFSDVDLLPLNDECLYQCHDDGPFQLTAAISKWSYNLPYDNYYGGIIAFTKEQFQKINGFSNLYFGWGGVDDDLLSRVKAKKYLKTRYTKEIGRFDMVKHTRDKGNNANPDRTALLRYALARQDKEGVSSAVYTRSKVEIKPLYTWIHVNINMTQILKNAPANSQQHIRTMYKTAKEFDQLIAKELKVAKNMKRRR